MGKVSEASGTSTRALGDHAAAGILCVRVVMIPAHRQQEEEEEEPQHRPTLSLLRLLLPRLHPR
jgi:hypothetical protein